MNTALGLSELLVRVCMVRLQWWAVDQLPHPHKLVIMMLFPFPFQGEAGEPIPVSSEEDIFEIIDMPFVKPEDRSSWTLNVINYHNYYYMK